MKRKRKNNSRRRKGKRKKQRIDWERWVSASRVGNYMMNDPILDYFKYKRSRRRGASTEAGGTSFYSFILDQGNKFEEEIMKKIKHKFGTSVVQIASSGEESRQPEKARATLKAMKKGVPIIYQGVLHNHKSQTYGMPDLIVRSDWLGKLVNHDPLDDDERTKQAPALLGGPATRRARRRAGYHYCIVDIKMSTLHLKSNGENLLKKGRIPAYKGQLYIYNEALAEVQGFKPTKAYLLGRRWVHKRMGITTIVNDPFDKLGIVDFAGMDHMAVKKTDDAIVWIKDLYKNGSKWCIDPPDRPELFPNMKNRYDAPFHKQKEKLAEKNKELTSLWYCGIKNRAFAHEKKIYKWTDPQCTADLLELGEKRGAVLDKILEVNRDSTEVVLPIIIENNERFWQDMRDDGNHMEMFIDFETVSSGVMPITQLVDGTAQNLIYMIGVGYITGASDDIADTAGTSDDAVGNSDDTAGTSSGIWTYKSFIADELSVKAEYDILCQFYNFIVKVVGANPARPWSRRGGSSGKTPVMYHWGNAELAFFRGACRRHKFAPFKDGMIESCMFDFLKVIQSEPVVIKGALSFGLKTFTNNLHDHGLINCQWNAEECDSGLESMIIARAASEESKKMKRPMRESPSMQSIERYNEVDCRAVYEIISYLRQNHTIRDIIDIGNSDITNQDIGNSDIGPSTSAEEDGEQIVEKVLEDFSDKCCFCDGDCNPASQACGACARQLSLL